MIAISFDTDWMQPGDLERFLVEFPFPGKGTFFLHRKFDVLCGSRHELNPHPFPVAPDEWKKSIQGLLDDYGVAPRGVRTHSCIHSHMLEMVLFELGFKYTSNSCRLLQRDIAPARLAWGLWELPIYYMDNLDMTAQQYWGGEQYVSFQEHVLSAALEGDSLFVFDFHPLHVTLNSPNLEYYLERAERLKAGTSPFDLRYEGRGAGTFFTRLTEMMIAKGAVSNTLSDAMHAYI